MTQQSQDKPGGAVAHRPKSAVWRKEPAVARPRSMNGKPPVAKGPATSQPLRGARWSSAGCWWRSSG